MTRRVLRRRRPVERDLHDRALVRAGPEVFAHSEQTTMLQCEPAELRARRRERLREPRPGAGGVPGGRRHRRSTGCHRHPPSIRRRRTRAPANAHPMVRAVISSPVELRTVTRPPPEATPSPHQISSPTMRAPSIRGAERATSEAVNGNSRNRTAKSCSEPSQACVDTRRHTVCVGFSRCSTVLTCPSDVCQ